MQRGLVEGLRWGKRSLRRELREQDWGHSRQREREESAVLPAPGFLKMLLLTANLLSPPVISSGLSVEFSHLVVSYFLQPQGLQHTRPPCPSPTPGACSNSCPLSRWCHPTISSSVVRFSSCLQSFPASGSFLMSQFFTSGGKVLEFQLQHQSFQWTFRTDFL